MKPKLVAFGALLTTLGVGIVVSAPHSASAKSEFAAETGKPCATCHQNQSGGGPLKPFGEAFRANGYKLPAKK